MLPTYARAIQMSGPDLSYWALPPTVLRGVLDTICTCMSETDNAYCAVLTFRNDGICTSSRVAGAAQSKSVVTGERMLLQMVLCGILRYVKVLQATELSRGAPRYCAQL